MPVALSLLIRFPIEGQSGEGKLGMKTFVKIAAAAAIALAGVSSTAVSAQQMDRIAGHPNINGIWQALNEAHWDLEPHNSETNPVAERTIYASPFWDGLPGIPVQEDDENERPVINNLLRLNNLIVFY